MPETKDVLRSLSYGVYIVSSFRGEGDTLETNAMTARMVSQVSSRPALISLSIRKRSLTHEIIGESGVFAVHVLAQGQELLAGHFGLRSGKQVRKFAGIEYRRGCTGAPLLDECHSWMECRLRTAHDTGTFVLLIGEVVHAGKGLLHSRTPLVYRKSDYYG